MECKRCGGKDHPNANCFACPENLIRKKIESWDGACLAECVITDAVIAGFFDADGCINFDNEGHFRVQLCQSHQFGLDVLHLIQLWFGSGSLTGPARNAEYKLRWCGNAGTTVLECCLLYGVIKGSNHLRFYNMSDEWLGGLFAGDGAKYAFPTQASRIIQSTVKIPPRTGVQMGSPQQPLTSSAKGRVIQITLPAQGYLNPLESYLRFDLGFTSTNTGANPVVIAPRILNSVHTMFRRMRVLYGSMVLEDIQLYNALVRTLTNVAVESEYQSGVGSVLEGMGSDSARGQLFNPTVRGPSTGGVGTGGVLSVDSTKASLATQATSADAANFNQPQPGRASVMASTTINQDGLIKHTFTVQLASGILTQQKLIPLKWLANQLTIELEIEEPSMFIVQGITALNVGAGASGVATVAPALSEEVVPPEYNAGTDVGTAAGTAFDIDAEANAGNIGYYLDNIYYVAEILEFDSTYDAAFFQGMASGGVPIKFSSWHTHQHVLAGTSTILTIQERARSVKSAFSIIRRRNDQDTSTFRSDPYWCYPGTATSYSGGSAATFWHENGAAIDEFQWRIGGRYFPSQPIKCNNGGAEPLIELQKALNLLGDYSLAPPIAQRNWMAPRGLFVLSSEFEATNGFEMSGINAEELADLALVIKLANGGAGRANATSTTVAYDAASFSNVADAGQMYATTFVNYDALLIIRPNNVMELVQ